MEQTEHVLSPLKVSCNRLPVRVADNLPLGPMLTLTIFHQHAVQSGVRKASTLKILRFFGTITDKFAACVETALTWLTRRAAD
jgi:hypothetical protein